MPFCAARTSSYTYGGGNCIEVKPALLTASGRYHGMYVTDSKQVSPLAPILAVPGTAWREFTARVKAGTAVREG